MRTQVWRDEAGKQVDPPQGVHAVRVNKLMGGHVDVWKDVDGRNVNNALLPTPVAGMTATYSGEGWIIGGTISDGSTPR